MRCPTLRSRTAPGGRRRRSEGPAPGSRPDTGTVPAARSLRACRGGRRVEHWTTPAGSPTGACEGRNGSPRRPSRADDVREHQLVAAPCGGTTEAISQRLPRVLHHLARVRHTRPVNPGDLRIEVGPSLRPRDDGVDGGRLRSRQTRTIDPTKLCQGRPRAQVDGFRRAVVGLLPGERGAVSNAVVCGLGEATCEPSAVAWSGRSHQTKAAAWKVASSLVGPAWLARTGRGTFDQSSAGSVGASQESAIAPLGFGQCISFIVDDPIRATPSKAAPKKPT